MSTPAGTQYKSLVTYSLSVDELTCTSRPKVDEVLLIASQFKFGELREIKTDQQVTLRKITVVTVVAYFTNCQRHSIVTKRGRIAVLAIRRVWLAV